MDTKAYNKIYWKKYSEEHKEELNNKRKVRQLKLKIEVFSHYNKGEPMCSYCSFSDIRSLSIDHINGGGLKHFRQLGLYGERFYLWLKRNNYPEGYQVLCMNCQFIKRYTNNELGKKKNRQRAEEPDGRLGLPTTKMLHLLPNCISDILSWHNHCI